MKTRIIITALALAFSGIAFADRYDDEIAAEKAGQQLADRINAQDEAGRKAAQQRYDKEHPTSSDSSGGGGFVVVVILAVGFLTIGKCCGWKGFSWD